MFPKCRVLRFYPIYKLTNGPVAISWMLTKHTRPLGQKQRTSLLTAKAAARAPQPLASGFPSLRDTRGQDKGLRMDACKQNGLCLEDRNAELGDSLPLWEAEATWPCFWGRQYSKSPTYEPLSCELSKMQTCIWFQQGTRIFAIYVRREWNCSLPSISYCWRSFGSTTSHPLSLLQSVTLLACSLDASPCMPAVVRYYCTFQGTVP